MFNIVKCSYKINVNIKHIIQYMYDSFLVKLREVSISA
jgi:hypothetical protein